MDANIVIVSYFVGLCLVCFIVICSSLLPALPMEVMFLSEIRIRCGHIYCCSVNFYLSSIRIYVIRNLHEGEKVSQKVQDGHTDTLTNRRAAWFENGLKMLCYMHRYTIDNGKFVDISLMWPHLYICPDAPLCPVPEIYCLLLWIQGFVPQITSCIDKSFCWAIWATSLALIKLIYLSLNLVSSE